MNPMKQQQAPASGGGRGKARGEREGTIQPWRVVVDGRTVQWRTGMAYTRVLSWKGRVRLDGRRHEVYGPTKTDVAGKLLGLRRSSEEGISPGAGKETLEAHVAEWLPVLKRTSKTYSAYKSNETNLRLNVLPIRVGAKIMGQRTLTELAKQPGLIDDLYGELSQRLAHNTVVHVHVALHKALKQAVNRGKIPFNPADRIAKPTLKKVEMFPLTAAQADRLRDFVGDDPLEALWVLAVTHGPRQGELLALRWKDVGADAIFIDSNMTRIEGPAEARTAYERGDTKNKKGRRVTLSGIAREALQRHRQRLHDTDVVPLDGMHVFTHPRTGGPLNQSHINYRWHKIRDSLGLPKETRFHDLRHTAATLLLEANMHPKMVSEMLGHASVAITLDMYSKVTATMQQEVANAIDQIYGRARTSEAEAHPNSKLGG
jgi:integrase